MVDEEIDYVSAQEFALVEQLLQEHGISDKMIEEHINDVFAIFEDVLE